MQCLCTKRCPGRDFRSKAFELRSYHAIDVSRLLKSPSQCESDNTVIWLVFTIHIGGDEHEKQVSAMSSEEQWNRKQPFLLEFQYPIRLFEM